MNNNAKSPSFVKRLACLIANILRINRLTHRVEVNEQRLDASEQLAGIVQRRLDALEILASTSQQRLEALEAIASTSRQRLDALDAIAVAVRQRLDTIETSVIPNVEQALKEEIYSQVRNFEKRLNQEKVFHSSQARRPRLAYVSPFPPERSGISNYSAELLPELARYYNIEVIVVQPAISDPWTNTYCPVRDAAWFQQHASDYDRVIYQFGNSPFHSHMFALLRQYPGMVVLHDFFLSSVLAYEENSGAMPGVWTQALYHSHGYLAVQASFGVNGIEHARNTYPCNLEVLQHAQGVIVHSEYSRQLARQWYGAHAAGDWHVIPHLRAAVTATDRTAARQALGISEEAFVMCSFGFIDPTKLTHRLLDAWLASRLRTDPNCWLVLVGENHPGDYGMQLAERIRNSGYGDRIRITGWADDTAYAQYLQAADVCVQLRGLSRGETSGAVLHCMNYGLPVIVNANGSMAELPPDVTWRLPDAFDDTELVAAMESLWENPAKRTELGHAAREFIRTRHHPSLCAKLYAEAIETAYRDIASESQAQERGQHKLMPRQLLVDVSAIARNDLQTGIERVVRAQLSELLRQAPAGIRVEPVYLTNEGGDWHYRYARSYTCKILGMPSAKLSDAPVEARLGDMLYAPDFFPEGVINAARSGLYANWREHGVSVTFLIHDLLPVLRPEFFPEQADKLHAEWLECVATNADGLICISNAVADEVRQWIGQREKLAIRPPRINVLHHGADITASVPSVGLPEDAPQLLKQIGNLPSFLMVGTVEPRKGHLQTLEAFEQLWRDGEQVQLVIVGKEGWTALPDAQRRTIPEIVARLRHHPELGKRLFWLEDATDEYLQKIYAACTCLIFASEGEGFGLPLIEAARYKLPIIARDIPVFREVAQQNAYYFSGLAGSDLAGAIHDWLQLSEDGKAPVSTSIHSHTWAENAEELVAVLSEISVQGNP